MLFLVHLTNPLTNAMPHTQQTTKAPVYLEHYGGNRTPPSKYLSFQIDPPMNYTIASINKTFPIWGQWMIMFKMILLPLWHLLLGVILLRLLPTASSYFCRGFFCWSYFCRGHFCQGHFCQGFFCQDYCQYGSCQYEYCKWVCITVFTANELTSHSSEDTAVVASGADITELCEHLLLNFPKDWKKQM